MVNIYGCLVVINKLDLFDIYIILIEKKYGEEKTNDISET
jgi:hypothetical protein